MSQQKLFRQTEFCRKRGLKPPPRPDLSGPLNKKQQRQLEREFRKAERQRQEELMLARRARERRQQQSI